MEFKAIKSGERNWNDKQALMIMWVNKWYVWRCTTKRLTMSDRQQQRIESDMKMINKF